MRILCKLGLHAWRLPLPPYGDQRWHPGEILYHNVREARFCPRCGLHRERQDRYFEDQLERMKRRWEKENPASEPKKEER